MKPGIENKEISNPEVSIEKASEEDAVAILNIQYRTWRDTYVNDELGVTAEDIDERFGVNNPKLWESKIQKWKETISGQDDTYAVFVAKLNGKVVGFNRPGITPDGRGRPYAMYVLPETQGKGVGTELFKRSLEFLGDRDLFLHVASFNDKAINFYKSFGFIENGPVKDEGVSPMPNGAVIPETEMVKPRS